MLGLPCLQRLSCPHVRQISDLFIPVGGDVCIVGARSAPPDGIPVVVAPSLNLVLYIILVLQHKKPRVGGWEIKPDVAFMRQCCGFCVKFTLCLSLPRNSIVPLSSPLSVYCSGWLLLPMVG